ncbi:MAG: bifunctional 5,10-methylenetetrahydrofolate dehydrogenase/5,10-methenyltetrahydrofolate cyclohydrolase [Chitinophagaceae bacterium]|nr:bifunctional 5,10-methylenetetrahydrofolate dehydrogenase/5,10-methenyltetrahydrofolate cyclohydrolase [Chitinophagaceae bacterium]
MLVLDGKICSQHIKHELSQKVESFKANGKRVPHLAAILVGNNGASETYVANKVKSCAEVGYQSTLIRYKDDISELELLQAIEELNLNTEIDGILVQLPLPNHISELKVIETISPKKDVDGFHPLNSGRLVQGHPTFAPATPYGMTMLMEYFNIETKGKNAVVIGRSNIVGRPMSILLSGNHTYGNCTVTICHSHTKNLEEICSQADILVTAMGKPGFIKSNMVKEGAIVIDVGITRVDDETAARGYRIKGDVDFDDVATKAGAISPVPGGVGLMTIAGLLKNTMKAYLNNN